jgi:tetratricopeptide (TPR) repeat protein
VSLIQGIFSMCFNFLCKRLKYRAFGFGVFLIFSTFVSAQTTSKLSYLSLEKLQKADECYSLLDYTGALSLYLEVFEKVGEDTSIICKIANTYKQLNDSKDAEEWYRKAVINNENTIKPSIKLQFAQVLTINGKYDEAVYWFKSYYKSISFDKRAVEAIKSIENMSSFYLDTMFYVVYPVAFNTTYAEFSPTYYKNGLLFLTDRGDPKSGLVSRFFSVIDTSGNFGKPTKFTTGVKTDYNEGSVTFYDNYRKMIFNQNYSPDKISRKKVNDIPLQLFSAQLDMNNKWENFLLLPFQDKNYSYAQPSITEDGKKLYFSSNIPGGFGGNDVYVSAFENGNWTKPANLGKQINSPGDEMFPFIYRDSILYFSSNGHGGLGGLDLFKINLKDTGTLKNLGVPMNSSNDDFGIILGNEGQAGYFASNRANGSGGDDIYGFKEIRITVTIKIVDKNTTLPVAKARIYSVGKNNDNEIKIGVTDEEGICMMVIPASKSFKMRIEKENYESQIFTFEAGKYTQNQLIVVNLNNESKPTEEDKIILTDENNKPIEDARNVIYKVQILACRRPVSNAELKRKYKGDLKINNFYEDNWYKYYIGEYSSYVDARNCVFSSNVFDAFIIAYMNQKKVHITIAKSATKETEVGLPIRQKH